MTADAIPFIRDLGECSERVAAALSRSPLVAEQLRRIQSWIEQGRKPVLEEVRALTLGLLALRELEATDPEFAFQLQAIHAFTIRWSGVSWENLLGTD